MEWSQIVVCFCIVLFLFINAYKAYFQGQGQNITKDATAAVIFQPLHEKSNDIFLRVGKTQNSLICCALYR